MRVLLLGQVSTQAEATLRRLLGDAHDLVVEHADTGPAAERAIRDAEVVVAVELPADLLRNARRLKLVHVPGAGWDRVDVAAIPPGAVLANAYEHEGAIGEFVLLQMLALIRELPLLDRSARAGDWSVGRDGPRPLHRELAGRTVGILGYGRIGREVARLARAFRLRVIAATRTPRQEDAADLDALVPMDRLDWLLEEAQFLVVALPLDAATRGLIGARELGLLGPDGYLVNVARGPIVDEAALYAALRDRTIAGAAIDTWYRYPSEPGTRTPVSDFPFWDLDNVIMTPHVAGLTEPTMARRWQVIADNIQRVARGDTPTTLVQRTPRP